ncbi:MAG: hypothetical protein L6R38_002796 [Xanthoria sp. 2 TBL-2021]|nr:MAG: hypothetical protein L6R38_002796 [Xanthoria sp. 2 TBL-2021]
MEKKRAHIGCPILDRGNSDDWFQSMEAYLQAEEQWDVIDLAEQISIQNQAPLAPVKPSSTPKAAPPSPYIIATQDRKQNAKAWFSIMICTSRDNQERIRSVCEQGLLDGPLQIKNNAPIAWITLREKYKQKLQGNNHQLKLDYMGYQKPKDKIIEDAWAELTRMARKVLVYKPSLAGETSADQRLKILLRSLPPEYAVIVDNIDSNPSMTFDRAMLLLQEKESTLKTSEEAMWANGNRGKKFLSGTKLLRPKELALRNSRSLSSS